MKTTISQRTIFEDIFARSTEDWVSDGEIHSLVMTRTGEIDPTTARSMALGVIVERIMREWMIPTTYNTSWNIDPWEAVRRIEDAWWKGRDRVGYLDIVQFIPTSEALEVGRAVLRGEDWDA
ncbi:hypothetical protein ACIPY2_11615 [Paenarthrobacter sp. NPDC089675]|uniref:hypothetical protein n=1 Tax=Paenarthrobacter sp. NPDC089675 TaxID=3364376 RepID=UPI003827E216